MIDSSSKKNPSKGFRPPYEDDEKKIQVMNMDEFMDQGERLRAQTYYKQVQQDRED
jgi:hypothetical protein